MIQRRRTFAGAAGSICYEYVHDLTVCEKCIHCRQIVVKNDDDIVK